MAIELFTAKDLQDTIEGKVGILFCFGKSFISKIIQAKTRIYSDEKVPSHVAVVYKKYIYESTTEVVKVNRKTVPAGVRRWQLHDYYKSEKRKETEYAFFEIENINKDNLEFYVHYPYGKDTIIDYLLTDGSDGVSSGLICSQYANKVFKISPHEAPTPADLYRALILKG